MNSAQSLKENILLRVWNLYKKLIIAFFLIIGLFGFGDLLVGNFLSFTQLLLTIKLASFIALFGLCQMLVISSGGDGLDLSVGYMATMTAVFTASIMDGKNENLWIAILVALGVGMLVGLANGFLSAYMKLPPLVVTMAMANILQGIINAYTAGADITGKPSPILEIIAAKSSWIFPNVVFVLLIVAVITMIVFYKTPWGLKVFGVGANETAAFLSGVNVKRVRLISFISCSMLASLIGLLLIGNLGIAFKDMGSIYVMPSIAAAVVGGVSLAGGDGNYIGVILGAIFLQTLTNLLVALGWGDAGKWLGFGLVLFVLLIVYVRNQRSR
jgi:ribose transport system permease protein